MSAYRVEEAFEAYAACELLDVDPDPPRVLSIDESAFKKRFHFHTVFSDPERGAVLDLVDGRGNGAVFGGLLAMSDEVRAGIETIVIDCHWPYRQAIEEALPQVRIVVDKFHIIRAVEPPPSGSADGWLAAATVNVSATPAASLASTTPPTTPRSIEPGGCS